jgi:hypothetical protein
VHRPSVTELVAERRLEGARKHGRTVLAALAAAHGELAAREVEVEDAQAQALREAQARAVE